MAQENNLENSIIGIWHDEVGPLENLLGSGAFITPKFVLTAAHVVDEQDCPKGVYIGGAAGGGITKLAISNIHPYPDLDIALLEIKEGILEQTLISIQCQQTKVIGELVDFRAFNRLTGNRDVQKNHTVGNLYDEHCGYLCDHQVLKGFSGGMVVLQDRAVGVIIERHKTDQQTLWVPIWQISDWLKTVLSADHFTQYISSQPVTAHQPQSLNAEFARTVREAIGKVLSRPRLSALKQKLQDRAPDHTPETLLVPQDADFDFSASIDILKVAMRDCLERFPDATPELKNGATKILGRLVLLAISEQWLEQNDNLKQQLMDAALIEMPTTTEAGTEALIARLSNHSAKFALSENKVLGSHQLGWDTFLETGVTQSDYLVELKCFIWKKVHGHDAPRPFTRTDEDDLKTTLEDRYKEGQHYHITIPANHCNQFDEQVFKQLRLDLGFLGAFRIATQHGEQIFVLAEGSLRAKIREFLLMLQNHS